MEMLRPMPSCGSHQDHHFSVGRLVHHDGLNWAQREQESTFGPYIYNRLNKQNGAGSGEGSKHSHCRIRWLFNDDMSKIKIRLQIRIRGGHVGHEILVI
jgi:arginine deiminase